MYPFSKLQEYNTVLLITVTRLYVRSPELINLINESVSLSSNISPFPHTLPLATSNLLSVSMPWRVPLLLMVLGG